MLDATLVGHADADLVAQYVVLAAAHCLLRYVENCRGTPYPPRSVRLVYGSDLAGKLVIDRRSSIHLELIANASTGTNNHFLNFSSVFLFFSFTAGSQSGRGGSLFGVVNQTITVIGKPAFLIDPNILLHFLVLFTHLHNLCLLCFGPC